MSRVLFLMCAAALGAHAATLATVTQIPEPASILLLLSSVGLGFAIGRRKQS